MVSSGTFNIAGVAQPGLLQLQATPFGYDIVTLIFQFTKPDGQFAVLMTGVDNSQCADDYSAEGKNNYQ
jgi:hypothetical protein